MILDTDFIAHQYDSVEQATFTCEAPSNIALVKYWGKKELLLNSEKSSAKQIPANPSISFTLQNCKTITKTQFTKINQTNDFSFELLFEGKPKPTFNDKILDFLKRIELYCPYLKEYHIAIDSQNTFPHSSGIASSASAMAALAMNIMCLEKELNKALTDELFDKKASFLARLGSGSACRSIKGQVVIWGSNETSLESSDLFGVPFYNLHQNFKNYQDTILLVDKGEKQVSSTVGHNLMINHPFAQKRFEQAHENLSKMCAVLSSGDVESFIKIVESEALTLHAMMLTSMPYFILMKPNTLGIINKIWQFRAETSIPVCFTLDAGANVHVLYPENTKEKVLQFIKAELVDYCQNGQYICDQIGNGAQQLN